MVEPDTHEMTLAMSVTQILVARLDDLERPALRDAPPAPGLFHPMIGASDPALVSRPT
jgi:hypothetical protein